MRARPHLRNRHFAAPGGSGVPPLFERLVYYMLVPDLFSRIVLEAGLGLYWYTLSQPKQWVFFLLLMVEYVIHARAAVRGRFRYDQSLLSALLLMVLLVHGILVGMAWGNGTTKVITDSVPILCAALNIFLLCRVGAYEGFNFARLANANRIYAIAMVAVGFAAVSAGRPSIVSLGGAVPTAVCLSIFVVDLLMRRSASTRDLLILGAVLVPVVPNSTRTMLVVMIFALVVLFFRKIAVSPRRLYFATIGLILLVVTVPAVLPEDSLLMQRINATMSFDPTARTGSIGERQAEADAIDDKLRRLGTLAEIFGSGHGSTYEVVFTDGRIPENYSHAHYGWALFKLRYGEVGYLYLVIFTGLMVASAVRNFRAVQPENRIVAMLAVWGTVYVFTYAFFNLYVSGLQFVHSDRPVRNRPQLQAGRGQRLQAPAGRGVRMSGQGMRPLATPHRAGRA